MFNKNCETISLGVRPLREWRRRELRPVDGVIIWGVVRATQLAGRVQKLEQFADVAARPGHAPLLAAFRRIVRRARRTSSTVHAAENLKCNIRIFNKLEN
jgi:hypothetical protein